MKAVILAAGEGKRLRPFTETMPKVMIPVVNKPILEYVIDAVKNSGIEEIIVIIGYKKEVIMEYFREYNDVSIAWVEQKNQLGTAHALLQAKKYIDSPFVVIAGDNIIDTESISKLLQDESEFTVLVKEHTHPSKYGVVRIRDGALQGIIEKPEEESKSFISTGVYKFPPTVFETIEYLGLEGNHALSSVIQRLVTEKIKVQAIKTEFWMDVVFPWDIISINQMMSHTIPSSINGIIDKNVVMNGPISIGKGTHIYSGCYIIGPVMIGENCEIGPNTCIFPCTTIGHDSSIHSFCELRNSVLMNDVHIGPHSFLDHSIVGMGTVIHHNFSNISGATNCMIDQEYIQLDHMGTMIGEDCKIGSGVVIDPGVIIGRKCTVVPIKHLTKNIPSESKVM
jgi:glucose-1-phosphate thymidylyltransferase